MKKNYQLTYTALSNQNVRMKILQIDDNLVKIKNIHDDVNEIARVSFNTYSKYSNPFTLKKGKLKTASNNIKSILSSVNVAYQQILKISDDTKQILSKLDYNFSNLSAEQRMKIDEYAKQSSTLLKHNFLENSNFGFIIYLGKTKIWGLGKTEMNK